jgi:3-isopropylmalate dehydrogenase
MASILRRALEMTLLDNWRTADLQGTARCSEFGERVRENLHQLLVRHGAHRELVAMNRGCCG